MRTTKTYPTRDNAQRFAPFLERGMMNGVPTDWQLLQGEAEMAPYVVLPDAGDQRRYDGAPFGHPLLRTPLLLRQIGIEHLRIGHGLHTSVDAQLLHLNYVFHEGMPVYDLQLVHTMPDGLPRLRALMEGLQAPDTPALRRHRHRISLIIPDADAYRQAFIEPGGYLDRAEVFDYPTPDEAAEFLRPEFTSLCSFVNHCLVAYEPTPRAGRLRAAARLARLATVRLRHSDTAFLGRLVGVRA